MRRRRGGKFKLGYHFTYRIPQKVVKINRYNKKFYFALTTTKKGGIIFSNLLVVGRRERFGFSAEGKRIYTHRKRDFRGRDASAAGRHAAASRSGRVAPVSYTHLDVYKRQTVSIYKYEQL